MIMGNKSCIVRLPEDVRKSIERLLADPANTLDGVMAALRAAFPDRDDLPSRSSLGRYGQRLNQRLAAIRASTEAARIISEQAGDEKDLRSEAVLALVQSELFEVIVNLQEATDADDPAERVGLLSNAAKNIATLTRASIALKRHQRQVSDAIAAKVAEMERAAKSGSGLDADTLRRVREEIYGITDPHERSKKTS